MKNRIKKRFIFFFIACEYSLNLTLLRRVGILDFSVIVVWEFGLLFRSCVNFVFLICTKYMCCSTFVPDFVNFHDVFPIFWPHFTGSLPEAPIKNHHLRAAYGALRFSAEQLCSYRIFSPADPHVRINGLLIKNTHPAFVFNFNLHHKLQKLYTLLLKKTYLIPHFIS